MLTLIADDKIPLVHELFSDIATVTLLPASAITRDAVANADILLVRSVTRVNADLLSGSRVKFIGSATAGYDNLDITWLQQHGIAMTTSAGANSIAVCEYILCCLAYLYKQQLLPKYPLKAAVIGMGHIGSLVAHRLQALGYQVMTHDPLRASLDPNFISTPFEQLASADVISLHTALTSIGPHPTLHLLDTQFLSKLKPGTVLLNTSRGAVIDTAALLKTNDLILCLDVWENEPNLSLPLLKQTTIATPHIAGYSKNAKTNGIMAIYQHVLTYFGLQSTSVIKKFQPASPALTIDISQCLTWYDVLLKIYNPIDDTEHLKKMLFAYPEAVSTHFKELRQQFVWREEFSSVWLRPKVTTSLKNILTSLGFDKSIN